MSTWEDIKNNSNELKKSYDEQTTDDKIEKIVSASKNNNMAIHVYKILETFQTQHC